MEERMEEPYIEGVATRDGPESCVGFRKGVGEALTGVRIGWLRISVIVNAWIG